MFSFFRPRKTTFTDILQKAVLKARMQLLEQETALDYHTAMRDMLRSRITRMEEELARELLKVSGNQLPPARSNGGRGKQK